MKNGRWKSRASTRILAVGLQKRVDDLAEIRVVFDEPFDLLDGVHDGGMVLVVEEASDLRIGQVRQPATEIHGDLARKSDRFGVGFGLHVRDAQAVVSGHDLQDFGGIDAGVFAAHEVPERLSGKLDGKRPAGQGRESQDAVQAAFELADVGLDRASDEERHVVGHLDFLCRRLLADDRHLHLQIGRLNVRDQSPLEAGSQPFLERGNLFGQGIGGDHDLLLRVGVIVSGGNTVAVDFNR